MNKCFRPSPSPTKTKKRVDEEYQSISILTKPSVVDMKFGNDSRVLGIVSHKFPHRRYFSTQKRVQETIFGNKSHLDRDCSIIRLGGSFILSIDSLKSDRKGRFPLAASREDLKRFREEGKKRERFLSAFFFWEAEQNFDFVDAPPYQTMNILGPPPPQVH